MMPVTSITVATFSLMGCPVRIRFNAGPEPRTGLTLDLKCLVTDRDVQRFPLVQNAVVHAFCHGFYVPQAVPVLSLLH